MTSLPMADTQLTTPAQAARQRAPGDAWRERFFFGLTLALGMMLWIPQALRWMNDSDFGPHGDDVRRTLESLIWVMTHVPHFMFQALSAGVSRLLGWDVPYSMALVILLAMLATTGILFVVYRRALAGDAALSWGQGTLVCAAVLATLVVAPFNLLTPQTLYFGYIAPNVWHNPTVNLMKPSALVLFFSGLLVYQAGFRPRPLALWTAAYALLSIFCLFSKPNFLIAFLPALALITLAAMLRRQAIHWVILLGGIVLPTGLMLLIQTQTWSTNAGIELSPLETFGLWAYHYDPTANQGLLLKFGLSVLFPAVVYLVHARAAGRDLAFNAAWLTFAFGLAYTTLVVDRSNPTAGDFTWSAQFGVYLLFVVALRFLFQRYGQGRARPGWALWACMAALALHVAAGINWYGVHLTNTYQDIIYIWW